MRRCQFETRQRLSRSLHQVGILYTLLSLTTAILSDVAIFDGNSPLLCQLDAIFHAWTDAIVLIHNGCLGNLAPGQSGFYPQLPLAGDKVIEDLRIKQVTGNGRLTTQQRILQSTAGVERVALHIASIGA